MLSWQSSKFNSTLKIISIIVIEIIFIVFSSPLPISELNHRSLAGSPSPLKTDSRQLESAFSQEAPDCLAPPLKTARGNKQAPYITRIEQGGENIFFRDSETSTDAHLWIYKERGIVGAGFPPINAGVFVEMKEMPENLEVDIVDNTIHSVMHKDASLRGIEFKVDTNSDKLILLPVAGNMRDIRNLWRAKADPLAYRELKTYGDHMFTEPKVIEDEKEIKVKIHTKTQDGRCSHFLILRFPKGIKIEVKEGKREVPVEAGESLVFKCYYLHISSPEGEYISWIMEATTTDFKPLTLWDMKDIFEPYVFEFAEKLKEGARRVFELALKVAEFLIHPEVLHAGSPQFLTYFGRDTILWTWMFLVADKVFKSQFGSKNILKPRVVRSAIASVIERINYNGEVAHEEDLRLPSNDEKRFDYRMIDADFLMSGLLEEYIKTATEGEIGELLSQVNSKGESHTLVILRNLNFVLGKAMPYSEHTNDIDAYKYLVHMKGSDDPTGNWRDSIDGLGRGYYPFDVNAIWVPKILRAVRFLLENPYFKSLIEQELAKQPAGLENLRRIFDNASALKKAIDDWDKVGERFFMVQLEVEEWKQRLKNFYDWLKEEDPSRSGILLKDHIGYDASGKPITAEDFVYHNRLPVWAKDGFRYYGLALDVGGNLIRATNTDQVFWLLIEDLPYEKTRQVLQPLFVPASVGGLSMTDIGIITTNPMLADKYVINPALTSMEKESGTPIRCLWELADGTEYHWFVVWGFKVAMTEIGIMRQIVNLVRNRSPTPEIQLFWNALEKIQKSVEQNRGLENQEVITWKIEKDEQSPRLVAMPLGSKGRGSIISNIYQLWNTAVIAVMMTIEHIDSVLSSYDIRRLREEELLFMLLTESQPAAAALSDARRAQTEDTALAESKRALASIFREGILSPDEQKKRGRDVLESADFGSGRDVLLGVSSCNMVLSGHQGHNQKVSEEAVYDPAKGILQVIMERTDDSERFQNITKPDIEKLLEGRARSSIVILADPDKLSPADQEYLNRVYFDGTQAHEMGFSHIPPEAIRAILVPQSLEQIVRDACPSGVEIIVVPDRAPEALTIYREIEIGGIADWKSWEVNIAVPDYTSVLTEYLNGLSQGSWLIVHGVRLYTPNDLYSVADTKGLPSGSPYAVFRVLKETSVPLTIEEIIARLEEKRAPSTIERDISSLVVRNLIHREGLTKDAATTTYELTTTAKENADKILQLLHNLVEEFGYSPRNEEWVTIEPRLKEILAPAESATVSAQPAELQAQSKRRRHNSSEPALGRERILPGWGKKGGPLTKAEVPYYERLYKNLIDAGLEEPYTEIVTNTLIRSREESFNWLIKEGC